MDNYIYYFSKLALLILLSSVRMFSQTYTPPASRATSSRPNLITLFNNLVRIQDVKYNLSINNYSIQASNKDAALSAFSNSSQIFSPKRNSIKNLMRIYDRSGYPYSHNQSVFDQLPVKYPGFIGLYLNAPQDIYGGWGWQPNQLLQTAFVFGINAVICQASFLGSSFQASIDSNCTVWNSNKIYGLVRPPSGKGAINQPGDTSLFYPYNYNAYPGMIQAAHRFSELSKIYPQIQGIIIDDFFINYPDSITYYDLQEIKDALLGKTLEPNGLVDHNSNAATPNLKLYAVLYDQQITAGNLNTEQSISNLIDGVNFWMSDQNNYSNLNKYIDDINTFIYPGKNIIQGIYITGNPPDIIHNMLQKSFDLYDLGKISGVLLFAGEWLTEPYITQARWDSLAIPPLLDSLYYPYLGEAIGKVVDSGGHPISHALITVERIINGDTIVVAGKYTQSNGEYTFGGWAGKDSVINYEVNVQAPSFARTTVDVQLQDQKAISLPVITLHTATIVDYGKSDPPNNYSLSQNYPNPFNPTTTINYQLPSASYVTLRVYDILGREIATLVNKEQEKGSYSVVFSAIGRYEPSTTDNKQLTSGIFFYKLNAGNFNQIKKMLLLK